MNDTGSNLGRPMQFDPQVALEKATEVFWANGYDATSTTNLMEAMNLSKSSLYKTFGSKHELFMSCLQNYGKQNRDALRQELSKAKSGKAFLLDFFQYAISGKQQDNIRGCLIVNTACEFGISNQATGEFVKTEVIRMAELFQEAIERSQALGEISKDKNPKHLADALMVNLYGIRVLGKLNPKPNSMEPLLDQIRQQLE